MLKDLVLKNRSYRGYDHSYKIEREVLVDMIDHARVSASSMNIQPLKYYIAYEPELVEKVQAQTIWARQMPEIHLPHPGKEPTAFIIICQDTQIDDRLNFFLKDVGIAAQTMLLRAVEQGLGGIMIGSYSAAALREIFSMPEHIKPLLVVAVGKPDEQIELTDVKDGQFKYYRDENDVHYVPKRSLEEEILN